MNKINTRWAAKLLRTRNFVVMTDTESAICFKGVDPYSIEDRQILIAQTAELKMFITTLGKLAREHDKAYAKLFGVKRGTAQRVQPKTPKTPANSRKVQKITVH